MSHGRKEHRGGAIVPEPAQPRTTHSDMGDITFKVTIGVYASFTWHVRKDGILVLTSW
jgi:hypothetical protein